MGLHGMVGVLDSTGCEDGRGMNLGQKDSFADFPLFGLWRWFSVEFGPFLLCTSERPCDTASLLYCERGRKRRRVKKERNITVWHSRGL